MQKEKRYLFVSGNPRSGTNLLARILNLHPGIAIGGERYSKLWMTNSVGPEHFQKDRFADVRPEDTGVTQAQIRYTANVAEKFDDAIFVGDKMPKLWPFYDHLFETFQPMVLLFILRNPFSVALSHQERFENPDDLFPINGWASVTNWNRSLQTTLAAIESGAPIIVVSYEKLYASLDNLKPMFGRLGLDLQDANTEKISDGLRLFSERSRKPAKRHEALNHFVASSADFATYRELSEKHCILADVPFEAPLKKDHFRASDKPKTVEAN